MNSMQAVTEEPIAAEAAALERIADKIHDGRSLAECGLDLEAQAKERWIEGVLKQIEGLKEGRAAHSSDRDFHKWLRENNLDYSHQDRAALIGLGGDLDLARKVLSKTASRSYRSIWDEVKDQFTGAGKHTRRHSGTRTSDHTSGSRRTTPPVPDVEAAPPDIETDDFSEMIREAVACARVPSTRDAAIKALCAFGEKLAAAGYALDDVTVVLQRSAEQRSFNGKTEFEFTGVA